MKKLVITIVSTLLIIMQFVNCFAYDGIAYEEVAEPLEVVEENLMDEHLMNNRYIVKFKENSKLTVQNLKQRIVSDISDNIVNDKLVNLSSNETLEFDIFEKTDDLKVIEFNEKISVDSFVNQFTSETVGSVEYIQPDYLLELASDDIGLDIEIINNAEWSEELDAITEEVVERSLDIGVNNDVTIDTTEDIDDSLVLEEEYNISESNFTEQEILDDTLVIPEDFENGFAENVKIAVIDSGVDILHEEFSSRIINAWDFVNNSELTYSYAENGDYHHGTHVTGIIASNIPNANIMPLKVFEDGKAYTSDIIEAIEYAECNGATIVNCSWGSTDNNIALKETMQQSDMLFICAAGNNRIDLNEMPIYPACFDLDNIISVTSVNADKGLSYFSNYGGQQVDIAALGRNVYSTFPDNQYGEMSGTSMSAAYVTAMAAIAEAKEYEDIKSALLTTADKMSNLYGKVSEGRCVNIDNLKANITNNDIIQNMPEDDFDESGYEMTPAESWELFCSLDNVQVLAMNKRSLCLKNNGVVWNWGKNITNGFASGVQTALSTPVIVTGLNNVIQIAAGTSHNVALKSDGTVWAWGSNSDGQLGDGTTTKKSIPVQVVGLNDIIQIACNGNHGVALKADGTVWSWGNNYYGQLGDGTKTDRSIPCQINVLTDVVQLACGSDSMFFLKSNGTVWTCGANYCGQLGDGTTVQKSTPVQISTLNNIVQITSLTSHSMALSADGIIYSWGNNGYGQLGDGTKNVRYAPVVVSGISDAIKISTGENHSAALKSDGTVMVWGNNTYGQLGDNTTDMKLQPIRVDELNDISQISCGYDHTLCLDIQGNIFAWGSNHLGQLGYNRRTINCNPLNVSSVTDVDEVESGTHFSIALLKNGTIKSWGHSWSGMLGDGNNADSSVATNVVGLDSVKQISVGGYQTIAIKTDGTAWAWGYNNNGILGVSSSSNTPTQIQGIINAEQVLVGKNHSMFIEGNGTVWSCGKNTNGQLGNNTVVDSNIPVQAVGLLDVIQISAGQEHSLALKDDGTVWAWGDNSCGQLGDGTTNDKHIPIQVENLDNIVKIEANTNYNMALKNDGTVWVWGKNSSALLKSDSDTTITLPEQILELTNVIDIVAGDNHRFVIKSDGTVWAWGYNGHGQLGDGTYVNKSTPIQVVGLTDVQQVYAENINSFALKEDGTVWCWGNNGYGQLGDGTRYNRSTPRMVSGLTDVIDISVGYDHTMALKEDGTVWCWGSNCYGELGDNSVLRTLQPYCLTGQINDTQGNTYDDAHEITDNGVFESSINTSSDYDWYKFTATQTGTYSIYTDSEIDTCGELYTADGVITDTILNLNDDYDSVDLDFKITQALEAGNTYYLKVTHFASSNSGNYLLHIERPNNDLYSASISLNCVPGNEFVINTTATNILTFDNRTFELTYNSYYLELLDAMALEYGQQLTACEQGNIEILSVLPGRIIFRINNIEIPEGKVWSGTINAIRFKFNPSCNGTTEISIETN